MDEVDYLLRVFDFVCIRTFVSANMTCQVDDQFLFKRFREIACYYHFRSGVSLAFLPFETSDAVLSRQSRDLINWRKIKVETGKM